MFYFIRIIYSGGILKYKRGFKTHVHKDGILQQMTHGKILRQPMPLLILSVKRILQLLQMSLKVVYIIK